LHPKLKQRANQSEADGKPSAFSIIFFEKWRNHNGILLFEYMSQIRPIKKIITGESAVDGAGVRLTRVFGLREVREFDPFLMLDAFDSHEPSDYTRGFPWHPHRGIETVTYLIEGDIEHGDSLGNKGSIKDGDCQWMTAGSGIIHQEMPQATPRMWGAQLWINLPQKDKMVSPQYGDITKSNVPIVEEDKCTVRVIAGKYKETDGAFHGTHVDATYLDVMIAPGGKWKTLTDSSVTVFLYILSGALNIGEKSDATLVEEKHAVLFGTGDQIVVTATEKGTRFLFLSGQPLHEPIAWGGPIVMNTQEELNTAFREIDEGTFLRVGSK